MRKQIVIVMVLLCCAVTQGVAQSPCSEKFLTTNTTASINIEKPAMMNYDPTRTHPMIFDWTRRYFLLQSTAGALAHTQLLESPFFQANSSLPDHLVVEQDMHSKDGWELIRQDFGYEYQPYFPIDSTGLKRMDSFGQPDPTHHPFFILYNRYRGILRIFVSIGQTKEYSAASISIRSANDDMRTALLRNSPDTALQQALDAFTPLQLVTFMPFINETGRWLYAEFPMAYDPCTCLYQSSLIIEVKLFDVMVSSTGEQRYTESTAKTIWVFTPGAKDNASRIPEGAYPMYNQVLGTFNLLRTPKVKEYYEIETARIERTDNGKEVCSGVNTARRYYQLKDDIEYVVNPAAGFDMENLEILGALVFEFDYDINEELGSGKSSLLVLDSTNRYRTQYVPLGCLQDLFVQFPYKEVPCIYDTLACMECEGGRYTYIKSMGIPPISRAPRVYLRFIVRMPPTATMAQKVFFTGNYPVTVLSIPNYDEQEWAINGVYNNIPNSRVFRHTHIAGRYDAWQSLTIGSNTSVGQFTTGNTHGERAQLIAGDIITVKAGASIREESTLRIGLPDVCSRKLPPVSAQDIDAFCWSKPYKDSHRFFKEAATGEQPQLPNGATVQLLGISPNPSQGEVAIRYAAEGEQAVRIAIVNPLGIEVGVVPTPIVGRAGERVAVFNGSHLARGVYYCVLECNGHKVTGKFVLY